MTAKPGSLAARKAGKGSGGLARAGGPAKFWRACEPDVWGSEPPGQPPDPAMAYAERVENGVDLTIILPDPCEGAGGPGRLGGAPES